MANDVEGNADRVGEGLGAELHAICKASRAAKLQVLPLPHLEALFPLAPVGAAERPTAIMALLAAAGSGLNDSRMRSATAVLFSDSRRWRNLGERQNEAGVEFDIHSRAGWTKRGPDGTPSHHDELLGALAAKLRELSRGVTDESIAVSNWGTNPTLAAPEQAVHSTAPKQRVTRGLVIIGSILAVASIAIVAIVFDRGSDDPSDAVATNSALTSEVVTSSSVAPPTTGASTTTPAAPTSTTASVQCLAPAGAPSADLAPGLADRVDLLVEELATIADSACGATAVRSFGDGFFQELALAGAPVGVLVAGPLTSPVRLTQTQWTSYKEIAGRDGMESSRDLAGYPVAVAYKGGASTVELSLGGVLVGRSSDVPHFWVPTILDARAIWAAEGGISGRLGFPTSNPFQPQDAEEEEWYENRWYQEFEFGFLSAPPDLNPSGTDLTIVVDRLAPLGDIDVLGKVITQAGKQAWYVDKQGTAHWIPSLDVWNCLDGPALLVADHLPGYTIAAFDQGPNATCEMRNR